MNNGFVSRFKARSRNRNLGFTLLELVMVITVLLIILTMSVPIYQSFVRRARETVLRENLFKMRQAIDNYTNDKDEAPKTLQDLVTAKYFRLIPIDPITRSSDTWQVKMEEEATSPNGTIGIRDVFSGAPGLSSEGTPYSEW